MKIVCSLIAWVGFAALVYGCYLWSPGLAFVVGGALLSTLAAFGYQELGSKKDNP